MFQWTTALTSEQTDSWFKLSTNPRIAIAGLCVISMPEQAICSLKREGKGTS